MDDCPFILFLDEFASNQSHACQRCSLPALPTATTLGGRATGCSTCPSVFATSGASVLSEISQPSASATIPWSVATRPIRLPLTSPPIIPTRDLGSAARAPAPRLLRSRQARAVIHAPFCATIPCCSFERISELVMVVFASSLVRTPAPALPDRVVVPTTASAPFSTVRPLPPFLTILQPEMHVVDVKVTETPKVLFRAISVLTNSAVECSCARSS